MVYVKIIPIHSLPYFASPYLFGQDNFYSKSTQQHEKRVGKEIQQKGKSEAWERKKFVCM